MKATPHAQQGSFQATFMACNQIFAMIWGQLIGIGLDTAGYEGTMIGLALLGVIVLAVFVTYYIVSLRKIIKANMAISAAETPAGDTRA